MPVNVFGRHVGARAQERGPVQLDVSGQALHHFFVVVAQHEGRASPAAPAWSTLSLARRTAWVQTEACACYAASTRRATHTFLRRGLGCRLLHRAPGRKPPGPAGVQRQRAESSTGEAQQARGRCQCRRSCPRRRLQTPEPRSSPRPALRGRMERRTQSPGAHQRTPPPARPAAAPPTVSTLSLQPRRLTLCLRSSCRLLRVHSSLASRFAAAGFSLS